MNALFGKKTDFDFSVSLVEKLSRMIVVFWTLRLVFETLGWTALLKLN